MPDWETMILARQEYIEAMEDDPGSEYIRRCIGGHGLPDAEDLWNDAGGQACE